MENISVQMTNSVCHCVVQNVTEIMYAFMLPKCHQYERVFDKYITWHSPHLGGKCAMILYVSLMLWFITITARICIVPTPTALDSSTSLAKNLRLKYKIKYKVYKMK